MWSFMPLTFPAHAAAILPLLHLPGTRRLSASALVVGCTAPDLSYLIGAQSSESHLPWGLLTFCLPAGLLAFVYLEWLLLPVVGPLLWPLLPKSCQRAGLRLLDPRPLPGRLAEWLAVGLAIVLGAASHQFWDGFTHPWMWPASVLYPGLRVPLLGHPVLVSKLLQHLSSLLGTVAAVLYVLATTPSSPGEPPRQGRAGGAQRLAHIVLWPLLGGVVAGMLRFHRYQESLAHAAWEGAWTFMAWFTLLLAAACLLVRITGGAK